MSDHRRAIALLGSKQFAAALPLFQAALRRSEQQPGGSSSAQTADILQKIGLCYAGMNDLRDAVEHYRRAAAICNCDFEDRIRVSLNAANALRFVEDYAEAEKDIRFSLSMIDTERLAGTTALLPRASRKGACNGAASSSSGSEKC